MITMKTLVIALIFLTIPTFLFSQSSLRVEPVKLTGPRELQEQTKDGSDSGLSGSMEEFQCSPESKPDGSFGRGFCGIAKDKLKETIKQQSALGLHTHYQDVSHDLQIVFYSPEGLSIEMTDKVEYDMQVFDHDKNLATQHVSARYVVVLTPSEVKWRVRVFQAMPE